MVEEFTALSCSPLKSTESWGWIQWQKKNLITLWDCKLKAAQSRCQWTKWTADFHVLGHLPAHSTVQTQLLFQINSKNSVMDAFQEQSGGYIYIVLIWWQITWGFFCSPFRIVCFVACKTGFSNILSAQWLKLKNTHDTWSTSEAFTTSILITQLVAAEESLMAVLGFKQTNPLHYALQVMHATGLVCSNSAAHNVLLKGRCSNRW